MRKKYLDEKSLYRFIWQNADPDGLWDGDSITLAAAFEVLEGEAHSALSKLCDRGLIQPVGTETYVITRWSDKNESAEKDLSWWEITTALRER